MWLKIIKFRLYSWGLNDQKRQKVLLVLLCFGIQTHAFQSYLFLFSIKMSIVSFLYLGRTIRFCIKKNMSSTSEVEFWLTEFGKVLLVLRYLDIPTCPSQKLLIWKFYQGLNWRSYIFKGLLDGIFSHFDPEFGI